MTQKLDLQMLTLRCLERHAEPVNVHQIAAETIMRAGWHPETREILAAIDGLREKGYPVADDDSGTDRRYWLNETLGGDAA
ncbi:hypothetical protein [Salinicola sp. DM10]|uniref:hypothetical protein n=1 Tax=Salinicola sp. DM10 TaxID=2815721 RepID=UPI001A8D3004|nr:hypothetical protein [Salinicola sp. DM10]MCE3025753.1 hypothetical protein [Salinicola sp. DM10]